jgi:hypothetical protein
MVTIIFLALKDLDHDRRRALLNIIALTAVIFSYLLLTALAQTLGTLGQGANVSRNLVVVEGDIFDPSDATLETSAVQAATDLVPDLVSLVSPMIFRHLRINDRMVQLRAVDQNDWTSVHHLSLVEGRWPNGVGEVVISDGAVAVAGWDLGSNITIHGQTFQAVGLVTLESTAFASIWMDLPVAQELYGPGSGYQLMVVEVARGADAETTHRVLQSDPRLAGRYQVFFEDNYTRRNAQALQDIQTTAQAISLIALLAVILGTYNATSLSLVERRRQIGILRVVGFKPGSVRQMLLLQALLQGLISYVLALLLALAFVAYQQSIWQLYVFGWPLSFTLTPGVIILGLVLTLGFSGLGALLATRSMVSASPVQAMAI